MSAWDDPDWFRDEREANPPEPERATIRAIFGVTEEDMAALDAIENAAFDATSALYQEWLVADGARLTREMAERGYRYVPNAVTVPISYLRCAECGKRLGDYGDCDACASSHAEHVATGGSGRGCRDCERA